METVPFLLASLGGGGEMGILAVAKAVHRGERGLGESYWVWLVIPAAATRVATEAINLNSLALLTGHAYIFYGSFFAVQLTFLGWLYYFGLGVIRRARKSDSRWATLASLMVWLSFVASPIIVGDNFLKVTGSDAAGPEDFQAEIGALSAQLPKRIDKITTMEAVSYSAGTIRYQYRLDGDGSTPMNWYALDLSLVNNNCSTFESNFNSGNLTSVTYSYMSSSGSHELNLDKEKCRTENKQRLTSTLTAESSFAGGIISFSKGLPRRVDAVTTITAVRYADNVLEYTYKIDEGAKGKVDWQVLKATGRPGECKTFAPYFRKGVLQSVQYKYEDQSGTDLQTIELVSADCG